MTMNGGVQLVDKAKMILRARKADESIITVAADIRVESWDRFVWYHESAGVDIPSIYYPAVDFSSSDMIDAWKFYPFNASQVECQADWAEATNSDTGTHSTDLAYTSGFGFENWTNSTTELGKPLLVKAETYVQNTVMQLTDIGGGEQFVDQFHLFITPSIFTEGDFSILEWGWAQQHNNTFFDQEDRTSVCEFYIWFDRATKVLAADGDDILENLSVATQYPGDLDYTWTSHPEFNAIRVTIPRANFNWFTENASGGTTQQVITFDLKAGVVASKSDSTPNDLMAGINLEATFSPPVIDLPRQSFFAAGSDNLKNLFGRELFGRKVIGKSGGVAQPGVNVNPPFFPTKLNDDVYSGFGDGVAINPDATPSSGGFSPMPIANMTPHWAEFGWCNPDHRMTPLSEGYDFPQQAEGTPDNWHGRNHIASRVGRIEADELYMEVPSLGVGDNNINMWFDRATINDERLPTNFLHQDGRIITLDTRRAYLFRGSPFNDWLSDAGTGFPGSDDPSLVRFWSTHDHNARIQPYRYDTAVPNTPLDRLPVFRPKEWLQDQFDEATGWRGGDLTDYQIDAGDSLMMLEGTIHSCVRTSDGVFYATTAENLTEKTAVTGGIPSDFIPFQDFWSADDFTLDLTGPTDPIAVGSFDSGPMGDPLTISSIAGNIVTKLGHQVVDDWNETGVFFTGAYKVNHGVVDDTSNTVLTDIDFSINSPNSWLNESGQPTWVTATSYEVGDQVEITATVPEIGEIRSISFECIQDHTSDANNRPQGELIPADTWDDYWSMSVTDPRGQDRVPFATVAYPILISVSSSNHVQFFSYGLGTLITAFVESLGGDPDFGDGISMPGGQYSVSRGNCPKQSGALNATEYVVPAWNVGWNLTDAGWGIWV